MWSTAGLVIAIHRGKEHDLLLASNQFQCAHGVHATGKGSGGMMSVCSIGGGAETDKLDADSVIQPDC